MVTRQFIQQHRDSILKIASQYGASDVRIFGLLMDLRSLLGTNVDVVEEGALSGRFGQIVCREAVPL